MLVRMRVPFALFAITFAIYALTCGARSLDVQSANFAAWKVATTGGTTFVEDDLPGLYHHPLRHIWIVENTDGEEAIGRSSGVVAASVPAYWLIQPEEFTNLPADLTAAALTATSIVLFLLTLLHLLPRRQALASALILALTTPVWSVAADGMWPHTLTVLGVLGMGWAAVRERWLLVGLFGGVMVWGRLHAAVICAVLGVAIAVARRDPRIVFKVGVPSTAMLLASCLWTRWFYGTWDPTAGYRTGDFAGNATSKGIDLLNHSGFWLAPDRGLLVWTPLLLLLLPSLIRCWSELPDWSRWLLIAGLVYLLVQGTFNRYSGGSAFFPYRLQLETLACAAPALALSAGGMRAALRRLLPHVLLLQGAVISAGAIGPLVVGEISGDRNELLAQGVTAAVLIGLCLAAPRLGEWLLSHDERRMAKSA